MKAADVMTRHVITVMPDATIEEAARLMLRHRISGLPVADRDGAILGIVTEGDLIQRAETDTEKQRPRWLELLVGPGRLAQEYVRSHARKVAEVMTTNVISVMPEASLRETVTLMEAKHVKRLPVIDGGRLVGIVSRANVMEAVVDLLCETPVATASDAEIRKRILAEIDQQPWGPRGSVEVTVIDGVVALDGTILDERERAALCVIAENAPGVKGIRDQLVWVDSVSGIVIPRP